MKHAVQLPAHDPIPLVSAIAAVTEHIGIAPTVSTTYVQPYKLARQLSTLDHLTNGRLGWNVVTSYLESEAVNLGLKERLPKALRYSRADEFLQVSYQLWEDSWEDDAVVKMRETDTYADPSKVHAIHHKGTFFDIPGPHLVEPSLKEHLFYFKLVPPKKVKRLLRSMQRLCLLNIPLLNHYEHMSQTFVQGHNNLAVMVKISLFFQWFYLLSVKLKKRLMKI